MLQLKPRGAPERLRELVISSVSMELASSQEQSLWFTRSEKRRFQFAGVLLLVSIVVCFAVEKHEQSRMARLHFKEAVLAMPRPKNHYFDKNYLRQVIELDPELKEYIRQDHGVD